MTIIFWILTTIALVIFIELLVHIVRAYRRIVHEDQNEYLLKAMRKFDEENK